MAHPRGYLRLKTCRLLHSQSQSRILWLQAVNNIYRRNGFPKPLLPPLDELNLRDLERLALTPSLFLRLVEGNHDEHIAPHSTRVLDQSTPVDGTLDSEHGASDPVNPNLAVRLVFLVPSGRFLVTLSGPDYNSVHQGGEDEDPEFLCLWDLGLGDLYPFRSAPIAKVEVELRGFHGPQISLSKDGRAVRVVGYGSPSLDHIVVYAIRLDVPQPEWEIIAELFDFPDSCIAVVQSGFKDNRVFIDTGQGVQLVWDFENDAISKWRELQWTEHAHFFGNYVLSTVHKISERRGEMSLHQLPPFEPFDDIADALLPYSSIADIRSKWNGLTELRLGWKEWVSFDSPSWVPVEFVVFASRFPIYTDAGGRLGHGLEVYYIGTPRSGGDSTITDDGVAEGEDIEDVEGMVPVPRLAGLTTDFIGPLPDDSIPLNYSHLSYLDGRIFFVSTQLDSEMPLRITACRLPPESSLPVDSEEGTKLSAGPTSTSTSTLSWSTVLLDFPYSDDQQEVEVYGEKCGVCPFSGRVVVASRDPDRDIGKDDIRVMDFVRSPSPMVPTSSRSTTT
ncbi:hypothetical protein CC1G_10708 [Coprinopsis cinerea okayama7|uniref:F-box domain-containing protein n=1 Tax=Coprinopsis cinerea (strain Okayama-7 / 130 / ATCC MYA-4618 / FGSC 9003) TaxID=240176 RepID=A8NBC7_COPC7|nr:hypothetical protein CC1G_10708 [Coprinopsis cinerea okayama7\|eukprot:XP_001832126.2 hypothetical protein CC1G_10708 [Coprinopsis cinerea okayama7\